MWKIFRAELAHQRLSIACVVSVWFAVNLAVVIWGWRDFTRDYHGTRTVLFSASMVIWFIRILRVGREKVNRLHITLPVRVSRIAAARASVYLGVWGLMVSLYVGSLVTFRYAELVPAVFYDLVALTGVILVLNALVLIHRDLLYTLSSRYRAVFVSLGYAVVLAIAFTSASILPRFAVLSGIRTAADAFRMSPTGAWIPLLIGTVMTYLSVVTYQMRKAYTD